MSFWNFILKGTQNLGVGVSNMPLVREGFPPHDSFQGAGRQVQRQLYPVARTPQVWAAQLASVVSIEGTSGGVYSAGQLMMQALSDYQKAQEQNGPSN